MKNLNKKIGSMVLVSGLLLGVGCLSGRSVVHANYNSNIENKADSKNNELSKLLKEIEDIFKQNSNYKVVANNADGSLWKFILSGEDEGLISLSYKFDDAQEFYHCIEGMKLEAGLYSGRVKNLGFVFKVDK